MSSPSPDERTTGVRAPKSCRPAEQRCTTSDGVRRSRVPVGAAANPSVPARLPYSTSDFPPSSPILPILLPSGRAAGLGHRRAAHGDPAGLDPTVLEPCHAAWRSY
jgi:hypothetical protein